MLLTADEALTLDISHMMVIMLRSCVALRNLNSLYYSKEAFEVLTSECCHFWEFCEVLKRLAILELTPDFKCNECGIISTAL